MGFLNEVKKISNQFSARVNHIDTEEATKNSLVLPFIQLLGYDIFDPTEVIPEFKVEMGTKGGEWVDYALFHSGMPVLLIECKTYGSSHSDAHLSRLLDFLKVKNTKFGLLTDGISYSFYLDLDHQNVHESVPFFEINILDYKESQVKKLIQFSKSEFNEEKSVARAYRQKYLEVIQNRIAQEFMDPSDDFIRFIMRSELTGSLSQELVNQFRPIVRGAFSEFVDICFASRSNPAPYIADPPTEPAAPKHSTELIDWTPLSQISHVTHRPSPVAIRFGKSDYSQIDCWRDVLQEVADWLVRTERLSKKDLPINGSGAGFTFVNSASNSPNGSGYRGPRQVSGGIFVETHYNANTLVKNCKKLLDHHLVDLDTVILRFG